MSTVYRLDAGGFTADQNAAVRLAARDIVAAWKMWNRLIPAQFALGSAFHETGYAVNERDVADQSDGTDSDGLFQISRQEAVDAGMGQADLFNLTGAVTVFRVLMEEKYYKILRAAKLNIGAMVPPDVWAYLSMAHNQGIGAVIETINKHGLHWDAYRQRNQGIKRPGFDGAAICRYGDDCIFGGPDWRPEFATTA